MTIAPKSPHTLRILHTADWHIGKQLMGEHRYEEFGEFLDWLAHTICEHEVDVLIVAGDIFDTMTPSNKAQELYYGFLAKLSGTTCHHVIIIAGNHDSPSLLNAPKTLFHHFNIFVVGAMSDDIHDEIITLKNQAGEPIALVCAVPYLRERDVREEHFGDIVERERSMLAGIAKHYATLARLCDKQHQNQELPIIATGHLFAAGAKSASDDDGMRKLYPSEHKIGSLGLVRADIFEGFDYVALGHIHREQTVGGQNHIRYSGSPMPFCFDEQNQQKKVLVVDFEGKTPHITALNVPTFRQLTHLTGDWEDIKSALYALTSSSRQDTDKDIWLSVECQKNAPADLKGEILTIIEHCPIKLLAYKKHHVVNLKSYGFNAQSLNEITPNDVFSALLTSHKSDNINHKKNTMMIDDDEADVLIKLYQEIIYEIENDDVMAF